MRPNVIILLFFCFLMSCAMNKEQELEIAIDQAQTYLSSGKCEQAISLLEKVGRQPGDSIYLQVLASAYSCRAGFSEITFLDRDLELIDTVEADFMGSLTKLSSSLETAADSGKYRDLRTALNIILVNGSSQSFRNSRFGSRKAADMGIQALFLSLAQLGKFLHYYGNVDNDGKKGMGSGPNQCFVSYTYNMAQFYLDGTTNGGSCNDLDSDVGHPDLSFVTANLPVTRRRMCEGLMLITNILDIVNGMDLPANSSLAKLKDVLGTINSFRNFAITTSPSLALLLNTTSQTSCETLVNSSGEFNNLQYLFALLFERGLP